MKKLLLAVCALVCLPAVGQSVRYDNHSWTTLANVPSGASAPILTNPYAQITVCFAPAVGSPCSNIAPVYSDAGLTHVITQPFKSDALGQFGFYLNPGSYFYSVKTAAGRTLGTFPFTAGGSGAGITELTSDVTTQTGSGSVPATVVGINNVPLSGFTGLLKLNNGTPAQAVVGDIPAGTLNNSISQNAATATRLVTAPTTCPTGQSPTGVDAQGNSVGCSATTGTTNASTITTGTLAKERLPATISSNTTGTAAAATSLSSTPAACPTGQSPNGVDAQGNALGCISATGTTNASAITTGTLAAARLPGTITSNTSGIAAQATALVTSPTVCGTGMAPTGVDAQGNALGCFTPTSTATAPMTPLVLKGNNAGAIIAVTPKTDLPYPGASANQLATGNNGIANAAADSNKNAIVEANYTGTDNEGGQYYNVSPSLATGGQLHSYRFGMEWHQHVDANRNVGNNLFPASINNCLRTQAITLGSEEHDCYDIADQSFGPGNDFGNAPIGAQGWTTNNTMDVIKNNFTRGIGNLFTLTHLANHAGDNTTIYIYQNCVGGFTAFSDEGCQAIKANFGENPTLMSGPLTYVSGGVIGIDKNSTPAQAADGLPVLDLVAPVFSGNMAGMTNPSGTSLVTPGLLTVTPANLTPPTFVGTLSNAVTVAASAQAGVSTSFTVNTTAGTLSTTKNLLILGAEYQEEAPVTAVVAGGGTATMRYSYPAGTPVYQNTKGILYLDMIGDRHATTGGSTYRSAIPVVAVDASHFAYRQPLQGGDAVNGITSFIHNFDGSTGLSQYTTWPGAEVSSVRQQTGNWDGGMNIAPNQVAWAVGDPVVQPHSQAVHMQGFGLDMNVDSPTTISNNRGAHIAARGYGVSSINFHMLLLDNENVHARNIYYGDGGYLAPPMGLVTRGFFQSIVFANDPPANGGSILRIASTSNAGIDTAYDIYDLNQLQFHAYADTVAGTINFIGPNGSHLLENGSTICTAANAASTTGCGSASGGSLPAGTGVVYGTSGTGSIATPAQLAAALKDPTKNGAVSFPTGTSGDSTLPAPTTGVDILGEKGGVLQLSHSGGAYTPLTALFDGAGAAVAAVATANVPTLWTGSVNFGAGQLAVDGTGNVAVSLSAGNVGNALPVCPIKTTAYWRSFCNANSPLVQVNGTTVSNQSLLNFVNSASVTFAPSGSGGVTATASGGGGSGGAQFTASGAASTPAATISGVPYTGGTSTTTLPLWLFQPTGATADTSWNTGGTELGINLGSSPAAVMAFDIKSYGHSIFSIDSSGDLTAGSANLASVSYNSIGSSSNCSSVTAPAVCGSAPNGSVTVAAGATTKVVNTTVVTANSQIMLTFDSSLGTKLGVTCNATATLPSVSARTPGTSFTITTTAPTTNPACFSYMVVN